MSTSEGILTWLSAVSANASPEGQGGNLIFQDSESLYLQKWNSNELREKFSITANAKAKTPAALISDNKVFAVDENDTLRCYIKPTDGKDVGSMWNEKNLGRGNIKIHPKSQLCALELSTQIILIYQDVDGALSLMQGNENDWKVVQLPFRNIQLGTPLAFIPFDDRDNIFYIGSDKKVHRISGSAIEMSWKDENFSEAAFEDPVSKMVIILREQNGKSVLHLFGKCGNEVVLVTESSEKPEIMPNRLRDIRLCSGKIPMGAAQFVGGLLFGIGTALGESGTRKGLETITGSSNSDGESDTRVGTGTATGSDEGISTETGTGIGEGSDKGIGMGLDERFNPH